MLRWILGLSLPALKHSPQGCLLSRVYLSVGPVSLRVLSSLTLYITREISSLPLLRGTPPQARRGPQSRSPGQPQMEGANIYQL